jgi:uncharacterized protein (TIGR02246 family)
MMPINDSEAEVRAVFERWIAAIQRHDLDATVAHHTDDIVLYDVPEPGHVEGLVAYRESFRDFLPFISNGGVFEASDLRIVAGDTAAFSHCMISCGSRPDNTFPVRLSLGYRKVGGEWLIAHEHHSVTAKD